MNLKSTLLVAGALLSANAFGQTANPLPDICKTVILYAADLMEQGFNDGAQDFPFKTLNLSQADFAQYQLQNIKYLGNCELDPSLASTKKNWCVVAGGSPDVFQADVLNPALNNNIATITVTANRGGCRIDSIKTP